MPRVLFSTERAGFLLFGQTEQGEQTLEVESLSSSPNPSAQFECNCCSLANHQEWLETQEVNQAIACSWIPLIVQYLLHLPPSTEQDS